MAIRITTDGKIVTREGLPSCTCCGECYPEQTSICMLFNDYIIGEQTVTLTGSLNGGSFTGIYDPDNFAYTVDLIWNEGLAVWEFWYQGVVLNGDTDLTSVAFITGETERCNPVGANLHYEDAMIIVDAQVLKFGICGWVFCVDNTNAILDNSWDVTLNGHLLGNYDGGDFTNVCFSVDEALLELTGYNEVVFTRTNCVSDDYFEFKLWDDTGAVRYSGSLSGDACYEGVDPVPLDTQAFQFNLP